jgi:hypothetical protein
VDLGARRSQVLIGANGHVKLTDFGLSSSAQRRKRAGTLPYTAPEVLRGEAASVAVDFYSLGVLLFELLEGATPFVTADSDTRNAQAMLRAILSGQPDVERLPVLVRDLVLGLLCCVPAERIDDAAVRRHPWLDGVAWGARRACADRHLLHLGWTRAVLSLAPCPLGGRALRRCPCAPVDCRSRGETPRLRGHGVRALSGVLADRLLEEIPPFVPTLADAADASYFVSSRAASQDEIFPVDDMLGDSGDSQENSFSYHGTPTQRARAASRCCHGVARRLCCDASRRARPHRVCGASVCPAGRFDGHVAHQLGVVARQLVALGHVGRQLARAHALLRDLPLVVRPARPLQPERELCQARGC